MEQEIDIKQKLTVWLSAPEKVGMEDISVLKDLTLQYPYFQPLHLLLAKASLNTPEQNESLATAALYTNGHLLHNLLHAPDELPRAHFKVIYPTSTEDVANQPELIGTAALDEVPAESNLDADQADEQEVFEEIGEVNIRDYNLPEESSNPEDGLVMENIVSTDFFAFQENFIGETVIPDQEHPSFEASKLRDRSIEEEPVIISKYDDDQLPYTFLWWLAKTRKEHEQIFQPYASLKKNEQADGRPGMIPQLQGELQHQYVEHIFHLQSPFKDDEGLAYTTDGFRNQSKGDEIIESFIKNDPQISPPKPEQIDNENKAKKSAEDHNDLVSETLAMIYIEQMLYDKAIETYEKLSLKFPEKSRYFADLIQSIEKKI